jgi:hypothetical protein
MAELKYSADTSKDYMNDIGRYLHKVNNGRSVRAADPNQPAFSPEAETMRQAVAVDKANAAEGPQEKLPGMRGSARRYTTAELDAMEQEAVGQGMDPEAAKSASESMSGGVEGGENFTGGVAASFKRTILGLRQALEYMTGDDAGRERVNEAIRELEARPELGTPAGKMGDATGTALQFMGPQAGATAAGKVVPLAITKGARLLTREPGSVGRAALQGGTFEATQPVQPSDAGTDEYLLAKGGKTAVGTAGGATVGKVGKMITSPGIPVAADRTAIVGEANRLGIKLTPAQRTGDITLSQFEEGLASRPGSAKIILDAREAQRKVLDKKAAEAIGSKGDAPNETVLATQRAIANKGYEPIASIPKMGWDTEYVTAIDRFAARQATKATGSTDAAQVAFRLRKGAGKLDGDGFLEELQGVRDLAFSARQNHDPATAKQLGKLAEIMEDYAERKVAKMAKLGQIPADAMDQLRAARTEIAKIHAIENATEPVSGRVSALKYLTGEFKRNPASKGKAQTPVATGLEDVGAAARVLKQTVPYVGSSGTAERIAGQQMVEASHGPLAAIRAAGPIAKNYLAAQYYMRYGGQPGVLGNRLTPTQNMYVKRLLPDAAFAGDEGAR